MAYTTELTDDCMGILHAGAGIVTGEDLLEACRSATQLVQNTENFYYEFIDFSRVTELRISETDLDRIVAQDYFAAVFRPTSTVVVVAPRDDLFQVGKRWQERVSDLGWKTHIARSRDEGISWLRENYPALPAKADPAIQSEA